MKKQVETRDGQIFESKIKWVEYQWRCRERNPLLKRTHSAKKSKRVHGVRYLAIQPCTKNPMPATISVASMSRMKRRSGNQSRIFFPTNEPKIIIEIGRASCRERTKSPV